MLFYFCREKDVTERNRAFLFCREIWIFPDLSSRKDLIIRSEVVFVYYFQNMKHLGQKFKADSFCKQLLHDCC